MLDTKVSEKPAKKHQNVSKDKDFEGITKAIGTAPLASTVTS
jgi:hypothetical protein